MPSPKLVLAGALTDIGYVYFYCVFILALHEGAAHMASQEKSETCPSLVFSVVLPGLGRLEREAKAVRSPLSLTSSSLFINKVFLFFTLVIYVAIYMRAGTDIY